MFQPVASLLRLAVAAHDTSTAGARQGQLLPTAVLVTRWRTGLVRTIINYRNKTTVANIISDNSYRTGMVLEL